MRRHTSLTLPLPVDVQLGRRLLRPPSVAPLTWPPPPRIRAPSTRTCPTRRAASSSALQRAQGAFLVDADRAGGVTRWIRVHSEVAAPLTLEHGLRGDLSVRDDQGRPLSWRETTPAASRSGSRAGPRQ
ncbi:hypothetical protein ACWGMA_29615 [Streptomyces asiaticus]